MKYVYYYDTVIGTIGIEENGIAVTGVYKCTDKKDPTVIEEETTLIKETARQLEEYFCGKRTMFDVPIEFEGTEFQQRVWKTLQTIPYGETRSYGQIAKQIENPKAVRAVGGANNKNKILIIVPCHRVVGANGSLVGFACGIDVKERLLKLEGSN